MSPLDRYLSQVSRHLAGLPSTVRRDVIQELRSNIEAQALDESGDFGTIVERMGSPKEMARSYRELYGYGTGPKVLAVFAAIVVAALTLPFSLGLSDVLGTPAVSNATLVALLILLVVVGLKMGPRLALATGLGAAVARFAGLGAGLALGVPGLSTEPIAVAAFILTTVLIALAGWIVAPKEASA